MNQTELIVFIYNTMQSETPDFAPGAATCRTRRNIVLCLILAYWLHYVKIMTSSTKPQVHNLLYCLIWKQS